MNLLQSNKWDQLVAVDVETSGINPFRHQILSLALVPISSEKPNLELFIQCKDAVWQEEASAYFSRYRKKWESNAIAPDAACRCIEAYIVKHFATPITLVGHNVGFDVAFLRQLAYLGGLDELPHISHRAVDTHTILYLLFIRGLIPEDALGSTGAFSFFRISMPESQRHSSIGDALATRDLFIKSLSMLYTHESRAGVLMTGIAPGLEPIIKSERH